MERFEDFVLEQVAGGASNIGLYPPTAPATLPLYEAWLARRGEK